MGHKLTEAQWFLKVKFFASLVLSTADSWVASGQRLYRVLPSKMDLEKEKMEVVEGQTLQQLFLWGVDDLRSIQANPV